LLAALVDDWVPDVFYVVVSKIFIECTEEIVRHASSCIRVSEYGDRWLKMSSAAIDLTLISPQLLLPAVAVSSCSLFFERLAMFDISCALQTKREH